MKAVDTNILARVILRDDPDQAALALAALSEPVWVSHTVWIELGWVLARRLRLERSVVADALAAMLAIETVHVADREGLAWAIDRFRAGADWADMVHLVTARSVADRFVTFDRGVALADDLPLPVVTLG